MNDITNSLTSVRRGLNDLDTSLDKCAFSVHVIFCSTYLCGPPRLRVKIHIPYTSLQTHVTRLQRLQQAGDVLRRTARFVVLARRLESQMRDMKVDSATDKEASKAHDTGAGLALDAEDGKERTIAKAALSIAELGMFLLETRVLHAFNIRDVLSVALLDGPSSDPSDPAVIPIDAHSKLEDDPNATYIPLRSVNAVAVHVSFIEDAREKVTGEMHAMVLTGLTTLVSFMFTP